MNIRQWLEKRKTISENRRKAKEINERILGEQAAEKLLNLTKDIMEKMSEVGFKPIKWSNHRRGSSFSSFYAVGPDLKVYHITVLIGGGYEIEKLKES